jgi:hypothetical protein
MLNELAMMMVMMWPFIPIFLIQLHFKADFWRRLGVWTYLVVFLEWAPIAFALYAFEGALTNFEVTLGIPFIS